MNDLLAPETRPDSTDESFRLTGVELSPAVVLASVVAMLAIAAAAANVRSMSAAHESAQLCSAINQAKQLQLAIINVASAQKSWPAAYSADPQGKPLLSWRVHILPYVEEGRLYRQFHLDEAWDSPHNLQFIERRPVPFESAGRTLPTGKTCWLAVAGSHTVIGPPFLHDTCPSLEGIRDGMITDPRDETIVLLEGNDAAAVIWTKPDDYDVDALPLRNDFHLRNGHVIVTHVDGSVSRIPATTTDEELRAIFTRDGREGIATAKGKEW